MSTQPYASICLPTRGRPDRFTEMYNSALETATYDVEVVAVVDDDDPTRFDYPEGPTYVTVEAGTHKQSDLWNVAWAHATGKIAHMGADDLIFRSEGWDFTVRNAFKQWRPDYVGMVYVNDLNPVRDHPFRAQTRADAIEGQYVFAANPFVSHEWIEAAGFFTPPFFKSWEADTWIYNLSQGVSRTAYLHRTIIEHMHPMAGKGVMDATYQAGAWYQTDLRKEVTAITRSPEMAALRSKQIADIGDYIRSRRAC